MTNWNPLLKDLSHVIRDPRNVLKFPCKPRSTSFKSFAAVVGVSEPNDPVKLADIVLVDEIEKLIDQLYLQSWTRAEDTQSVQNILNRAKSYIYYDKKKQTAITDYVTRN